MSLELPPPVTVEYQEDYDFYGPVELDPLACAMVLREFGVDDEHIASTTVVVSNEYVVDRKSDPEQPVIFDYRICSTSDFILTDGSGCIEVNMGSLQSASSESELSESALLIHGFSQRADLVQLGQEGLKAERLATKRSIRRSKAIKPAIQGILGAGAGITLDVLAEQHDILSTPVAWGVGVVIVGASAFFTKVGADIRYLHEVNCRTARHLWPDQLRGNRRTIEYMENPNSPPLIRG